MRSPSLRVLSIGLLLVGCGGTTKTVPDVSGIWACASSNAKCLSWTTDQPVLGVSAGTTSLTMTLSQTSGSTTFALSSQPSEGNGVTWSCPGTTLDGDTLQLGTCALTSGSCTSTAKPTVTFSEASGSTPSQLSWAAYSYTWTGSCIGNGITVTVQPFTLVSSG